ncbi:MAG: hypothetical protein U0V45_09265 [Flavobacteriales bacterium]|jgi:hypothetical protein|nr:hypothetical protein [Flavobacteriales bacterium]HNA33258.1 hypothetical protein [Flavobacteriales bacterium]
MYIGHEKSDSTFFHLPLEMGEAAVTCGTDTGYMKYTAYAKYFWPLNIMTEEEFDRTFSINLGSTIEDFLQNPVSENLFDVAIFSNVFHKIQDKEIPKKMLQWFTSYSTPKALLLIKVMTSNRYARENDWIYRELDLDELIACFPGRILSEDRDEDFASFLIQKRSK